jgi:hypothetical protein
MDTSLNLKEKKNGHLAVCVCVCACARACACACACVSLSLSIRVCSLLQVASISQLTVSRLSGKCGILNISKPYGAPLPVTGIALLYGDRVYFLYFYK